MKKWIIMALLFFFVITITACGFIENVEEPRLAKKMLIEEVPPPNSCFVNCPMDSCVAPCEAGWSPFCTCDPWGYSVCYCRHIPT